MEPVGACPSAVAWADLLVAGDPPEREREHLVSCAECREIVGWLASGMDGATPALRVPGRRRAFPAWAAAAAAVVVAAGLLAQWAVRGRGSGVTQGALLDAGGGVLRSFGVGEAIAGIEGGCARFADGTVVGCPPGAVFALASPGDGVRLHLDLLEGGIRLEVPPRDGAVVVDAGTCRVRVLGTRFRVALVRSVFAGPPLPVVEVESGRVEVTGGATRVVLRDGECAYGGEGLDVERWVKVPATPVWAARLADGLDRLLDRDPVPAVAARWIAELRAQGEAGIAEASAREADESLPEAVRARWTRILAAMREGASHE